jgi:preprotein translocase subunit SecD
MRTLVAIFLMSFLAGSALAENLVELRYVLTKQADGALAAKFDGDDLWLSPEVVVSDSDVEQSSVAPQEQEFSILLRLGKRGAKRFDEFAEAHLGDRIAILVRGKVVSAPVVREKKFGGTIQITGSFSKEEALALMSALNAKRE